MATRRIEVIIGGDAKAAQKAFRDTEAAAGTAQVKVEGFGKAFLKMGLAIGAAALLKQGADAIGEYSQKVQAAEISIAALTKSHAAVTRAQSLATREMEAGRAAYSDTLVALDALAPVSLRTGVAIEDLYKTSQLLATLNSGPGGGVEGAIVAISEALAGDWTSAIERFNLPRAEINRLKAEGVPALEILNRTLAESGVTMDTVTAKSKTGGQQWKILTDTLLKFGQEAGQPIFDKLVAGITNLNTALQSNAVKEFATGVRELFELAATGKVVEDFSIQARKSLFLVLDAYNNLLEGISGGRLSLDKPLAEMRASIVRDEANLRTAVQQGIAKPVADELKGALPSSPLAPAKVQGYGQAILDNFLKGASSADIGQLLDLSKLFPDTLKEKTPEFGAALSVVAQALAEVAQSGQISETTLYRLNSIFGKQTDTIAAQIVAYGQLTSATQAHTAATQAATAAEANLEQVRRNSIGDLANYQAGIDAATQAATDHAQAAADEVEGLQGRIEGVRNAAESAAREGAQELEGLQGDLSGLQDAAAQHAAARQTETEAAQAAYEQAQTRRQQIQGVLQAALNGELETYLRINDIHDESILKIAQKWQAEIEGARRAKQGADEGVAKLRHASNKEDLDFLTRIDAARKGGNEKEARRLEREYAARQKQRSAEMQLAQARAAVAGDEFDEKAKQLEKEGKAQDEKEGQAEKAAAANLTRIQQAAKAQADSDQAAIRAKQDEIAAVQRAQKAEADRYADQQRGIQAEISKVQEAAKVQAAKDKQAITDAQTLLTNRQAYWAVESTGAQAAVNLTGGIATGWERTEKAAKDWLDHIKEVAQILKDNPAVVTPLPSTTPAPGGGVSEGGGQTQGGAGTSPAPFVPNAPPPPPGALPPLKEAIRGFQPPPGYHAQLDPAGKLWWVPDGHDISEYIYQRDSPGSGSGGGKSQLAGGVESFSAGSPAFLRASGQGAAADGGTTIIINAPNLRDIRDKRDLADLGAHMERTWHDIKRGGRVKQDTGA